MIAKDRVLDLKKSPIYNFSLSSKELFHSNFIYWLLTDIIIGTNKEEGQLFWQLLCAKNQNMNVYENHVIDSEYSVKRESNNNDLVFGISNPTGNKLKVIIENKVKSIPNKEQLIQYASKASNNDVLILLSLHYPKEIANNEGIIQIDENKKWFVLSYKSFYSVLDDFVKVQTVSSDLYRYAIIKDYMKLILFLIEIDKYCEIESEECFDWHRNDICETLRELRIADFYLKGKFNNFSNLLKERIESNENYKNILSERIDWKSKNQQILITSGFTNGSGLFDVKFKFTSNFSVGVQVQGDQFRLVVEGTDKFLTEKFARELLQDKWFDFSKFSEHNAICSQRKELNCFGGVFWYRYVRLPDDMKVVELAGLITGYVELYFRKIPDLLEVLKKVSNTRLVS